MALHRPKCAPWKAAPTRTFRQLRKPSFRRDPRELKHEKTPLPVSRAGALHCAGESAHANPPGLMLQISTVSATSLNSAIWSKFM